MKLIQTAIILTLIEGLFLVAISCYGEIIDRNNGNIENEEIKINQLLNDKDFKIRRKTIEQLEESGVKDREVIKLIIDRLSDSNEYVRQASARALGNIGDKMAIEPLIATIKDKDEYVREAAVEALGKLEGRESADAVGLLVNDRYGLVRRAAVETLLRFGDEHSLYVLFNKLGQITGDEEIGKFKGHTWSNIFAAFNIDDSKDYEKQLVERYKSILSKIGELNPNRLYNPLIAIFINENNTIPQRLSAMGGLIKLKDDRIVPHLIELIYREIKDEGKLIKEAKSGVTNTAFLKARAIYALLRLKDDKSFSVLINILEDKSKDPYYREEAVKALEWRGDKRALEFLTEVLATEENENVKFDIKQAIEGLKKSEP